jgi:hypothetical protein
LAESRGLRVQVQRQRQLHSVPTLRTPRVDTYRFPSNKHHDAHGAHTLLEPADDTQSESTIAHDHHSTTHVPTGPRISLRTLASRPGPAQTRRREHVAWAARIPRRAEFLPSWVPPRLTLSLISQPNDSQTESPSMHSPPHLRARCNAYAVPAFTCPTPEPEWEFRCACIS